MFPCMATIHRGVNDAPWYHYPGTNRRRRTFPCTQFLPWVTASHFFVICTLRQCVHADISACRYASAVIGCCCCLEAAFAEHRLNFGLTVRRGSPSSISAKSWMSHSPMALHCRPLPSPRPTFSVCSQFRFRSHFHLKFPTFKMTGGFVAGP